MHPHLMLTYLIVSGVAIIFFFLLLLFFITTSDNNRQLLSSPFIPKAFAISTVAILLSSYFLSQAPHYFQTDQVHKLRDTFFIALILGGFFTVFQVSGWHDLYAKGITLSGNSVSYSYLFVISGLHLLHLAGGIVFLAILLRRYYVAAKDPVKALILITNSYERITLKMAITYWHFMDLLWIAIYVAFLIML